MQLKVRSFFDYGRFLKNDTTVRVCMFFGEWTCLCIEVLTLCELNISMQVLLPWQHPLKKMPEETMCDLCKMVAGYLKPLVDSSTTEVGDEIMFVLILCGISLVP